MGPGTDGTRIPRTLVVLQSVLIAVLGMLLALRSDHLVERPTVEAAGDRDDREPRAEARRGASGADATRAGNDAPADTSRRAVAEGQAFDDRLGIIVWGSVRSVDGTVPKLAVVGGFGSDAQPIDSVRVDDRGYVLAGLQPGDYTLRAFGEGHCTAEAQLELRAAVPRVRQDFVLEQASRIDVFVTDPEGRPVHAEATSFGLPAKSMFRVPLWVTATRDAPGERLWSLEPKQHGEVRWFAGEGDPASLGILEVRRPLPAHVVLALRDRVLASAPITPGQAEVRFTIRPEAAVDPKASVTVSVRDADTGQPLEGAQVGLLEFGEQQSGKDGSARFSPVLAGLAIVTAAAEGYCPARVQVDLDGRGPQEIAVDLEPATTLHGRVLDENGKPAHCLVRAVSLMRTHQPPGEWAHRRHATETDQDGRFQMERPTADCAVWASHSGYAGYARIGAGTPAGEEVTLRVTRGTRLHVRSEDPLATRSVVLRDESGLPAGWASGSDFLNLLVAPGDYTLEVHDARQLLEARPLTVEASGGVQMVDIR